MVNFVNYMGDCPDQFGLQGTCRGLFLLHSLRREGLPIVASTISWGWVLVCINVDSAEHPFLLSALDYDGICGFKFLP